MTNIDRSQSSNLNKTTNMSTTVSNDDSYSIAADLDEQQSQNYDIVTFDIRVKLLQMVCIQCYKISRAAKILNINESTAKYIVRTFKRTGKVLMKSSKNNIIDEKILNEFKQLQSQLNLSQKNSPISKIKQKKVDKRKIKNSKKILNGDKDHIKIEEPTIQDNDSICQIQREPKVEFCSEPNYLKIQQNVYCDNQIFLMPIYCNNIHQMLWLSTQNMNFM